MRRRTKAWLDSARDDLEVAEEIINRDDLTHMVAFHCQQAIEKSFKAVLEEHVQIVPRVHDLNTPPQSGLRSISNSKWGRIC